MIPDPEKVRFWQARAPAYDRLIRRWEVFSLLSSRLIASRRHGFELLSEHRDEELTPVSIGIDFQAMGADWPVKGMEPADRQILLQRMHELAQGKLESVVSTCFLFRSRIP